MFVSKIQALDAVSQKYRPNATPKQLLILLLFFEIFGLTSQFSTVRNLRHIKISILKKSYSKCKISKAYPTILRYYTLKS